MGTLKSAGGPGVRDLEAPEVLTMWPRGFPQSPTGGNQRSEVR